MNATDYLLTELTQKAVLLANVAAERDALKEQLAACEAAKQKAEADVQRLTDERDAFKAAAELLEHKEG